MLGGQLYESKCQVVNQCRPGDNCSDATDTENFLFQLQAKTTQQGTYESLCRDVTIVFGDWGFDPTKVKNPFPNGEGVVSIWQGYEDKIVRVEIQRYLAQQLPWVRYHEHPEAGHALPNMDGVGDDIIRELVLGEARKGWQN